MSVTAIVGLVLYILAILFGTVTVGGQKIGYPWRPILFIFLFPIVGAILTIIGLLGITMIEPFISFFGFHWFIVTNF